MSYEIDPTAHQFVFLGWSRNQGFKPQVNSEHHPVPKQLAKHAPPQSCWLHFLSQCIRIPSNCDSEMFRFDHTAIIST